MTTMTSPRFVRLGISTILLVCASLGTDSAFADDVQGCIEAHELAQVARKEGRLLEARDKLLTCAHDSCPSVLRKDCGPWLTEVTSSLPTVVVLARGPDGSDLLEVRVLFDGEEIATALDGRAIEVDPGVHTFRFETDGQEPIERKVVIREGVKNHELTVRFGGDDKEPASPSSSVGSPPDADMAGTRPVPVVVYVLGSLGVAGLATSVYFQAGGLSKRSDLDDRGCKPYCPADEVDAAKRDILIGDIALGVGIASLGAATYFYLSRPSISEKSAGARPPFDVVGVPGGGLASFRGQF